MNTLVYVDRQLATAMAAKLVGLQLHESQTIAAQGGLNWLIQANATHEDSVGITIDIRELLPEELMYKIYEEIEDDYKFKKVADCIENVATNSTLFRPGSPISIEGVLSFPELSNLGSFDPLEPPDIPVKTFRFHGEECFIGKIENDGFELPIYFQEAAKEQVAFCDQHPVEITGILRWSPPYSTKGARSLHLVTRAAALWLR